MGVSCSTSDPRFGSWRRACGAWDRYCPVPKVEKNEWGPRGSLEELKLAVRDLEASQTWNWVADFGAQRLGHLGPWVTGQVGWPDWLGGSMGEEGWVPELWVLQWKWQATRAGGLGL